jgi:outer membrane receptor protein involved in Fe transport
VLGGLRWIQYEKLNWNAAGASTPSYRENGVVTPTLAAMYKVASDTTAYASYVESLQQGATARLGNWWSLGGNVMLLDAEYASGEAAIVSHRVAGSPRSLTTAQLAYRVPEINGLQLRLGATYDTQVAGQVMTFRANINNLFDKKYCLYQYSNYIKAGDPPLQSA